MPIPDGTPIGLLLVLTYSTAAPVVTYTGTQYLEVHPRDFNLYVLERKFDDMTVRKRGFGLTVEDR